MKRAYLFVLAFLVGSILLGCGEEEKTKVDLADNNNKASEFELIASEKNLPSNFDDIAFERKEVPFFRYLVKKVENQPEYEDIWKLYGFENEIPSVDFNKKAIVFVGLQESGSCPYEIKNVELDAEYNTLLIFLLEPDWECTADATPRTFVINLNKDTSKVIENVRIIESGLETNVPF